MADAPVAPPVVRARPARRLVAAAAVGARRAARRGAAARAAGRTADAPLRAPAAAARGDGRAGAGASDVVVRYGRVPALRGVDLDGRPRRDRRADGAQRRRQVDAALGASSACDAPSQRHGRRSAAPAPSTLRGRDAGPPRRPGAAGAGRPARTPTGRRRVRGRRPRRAASPPGTDAGAARRGSRPASPTARTRATCREGQRLALALAVVLAAAPPVLLLDEPTRGLDYAAKQRLVDDPARARRRRATRSCSRPTTSSWRPRSRPGRRARRRRGRRRRPGRRRRRRLAGVRAAGGKVLAPAAVADRRRGRRGAGGRVMTAGGRSRPRTPRAVRLGASYGLASLLVASAVGVMAFGWPLLAGPGSLVVAHSDRRAVAVRRAAAALLAVVLAERRRRRPRRQGRRAARRARRRRLRRCARSAAGPPASSRCSSCWSSAAGCSAGASASCLGAVGDVRRRRCSPAASARGCRSRCSPRPGSASAPGCLPRATRPPRDRRCWRRTPPSSALAYGFLLNLWFWPFLTTDSGLPRACPSRRVRRRREPRALAAVRLATSLGFDLPRAALTLVLVVVVGRPVLLALRRATRRAAFDAPVVFVRQPAPG